MKKKNNTSQENINNNKNFHKYCLKKTINYLEPTNITENLQDNTNISSSQNKKQGILRLIYSKKYKLLIGVTYNGELILYSSSIEQNFKILEIFKVSEKSEPITDIIEINNEKLLLSVLNNGLKLYKLTMIKEDDKILYIISNENGFNEIHNFSNFAIEHIIQINNSNKKIFNVILSCDICNKELKIWKVNSEEIYAIDSCLKLPQNCQSLFSINKNEIMGLLKNKIFFLDYPKVISIFYINNVKLNTWKSTIIKINEKFIVVGGEDYFYLISIYCRQVVTTYENPNYIYMNIVFCSGTNKILMSKYKKNEKEYSIDEYVFDKNYKELNFVGCVVNNKYKCKKINSVIELEDDNFNKDENKNNKRKINVLICDGSTFEIWSKE